MPMRTTLIALFCQAALVAADRFEPTEFGWKDIDSRPYAGVYVNGLMAVAWSEAAGFYRWSTDAGNTWSGDVRPVLTSGDADRPLQAVATPTGIYVRTASGAVYGRTGATLSAGWAVPMASRLEVAGNGLLAVEEGGGSATAVIRDDRVAVRMPGRLVFAFAGWVASQDGSTVRSTDGREVRSTDLRQGMPAPPDTFPSSTGPGGEAMRGRDGARWNFSAGTLSRATEPTPGLTILSFGYGDAGAAGMGAALVRRQDGDRSALAVFAINRFDQALTIDRDASAQAGQDITAAAAAGRDAYGWRYIVAGPSGLRIGRLGAPRP